MSRSIVGGVGGGVGGGERGSSMEEVHQKLAQLQYPRSSAPSQSLLYAGLERYALLEWLFFRFDPSLCVPVFLCSFAFFFVCFSPIQWLLNSGLQSCGGFVCITNLYTHI